MPTYRQAMRPLFIISLLFISIFITNYSLAQCTVDNSYTVAVIYPSQLTVWLSDPAYS